MLKNWFWFLDDALSVMLHPFAFFKKLEEKRRIDAISYIVVLSLVIQIISIAFERIFMQMQIVPTLSEVFIKIIFVTIYSIFLVVFIFVLSAIPVLALARKHLSDDIKSKFKQDRKKASEWSSIIYTSEQKAIAYGITPFLIFAYPALAIEWNGISILFSNLLLYLSFYWIVLCVIGISKSCRISYLESFLSIALPSILISYGIIL